jgi:N-acetylglucosaminyldiphosphoundecaprenol N-acetyl-beta-D-mannosaminyltransferase
MRHRVPNLPWLNDADRFTWWALMKSQVLCLPGAKHHSNLEVLGFPVACTNSPLVVNQIGEWITEKSSRTICVTGMHGVMESQRNPEILAAHNSADLVVPDGMPLVWLGKFRHDPLIDRVYGPDLTEAVCERARIEGWRMHFVGGTPETGRRCLEELNRRYPDLLVTGHTSPPFRPLTAAEEREVIAEIVQFQPDILWVCLGAPKQELWMAKHRASLLGVVQIGTGAALDFLAGTVSQAPRWVQRSGLEWLYRLIQEPRRLWRRYLINIPQFLVLILLRLPSIKNN